MYKNPLEGRLALGASRVSAQKLVTEADLQASQRQKMKLFAEKHRFVIAKALDYADSATNDRKKLYVEEIFKYFENHPEISFLLVKDISRLYRVWVNENIAIKERLEGLGVTLLDTDVEINPTKINSVGMPIRKEHR